MPRWPKSQDFACGLLKQDILCVNQACRTSSFTVQTASTDPSAVATMDTTWQRPVQLRMRQRMPQSSDIPEDRDIFRLLDLLALLSLWPFPECWETQKAMVRFDRQR